VRAGVLFLATIVTAASACSLLVDTNGLSGESADAAVASDAPSDATADASDGASSADAAKESGVDAGDAGSRYANTVLADSPIAYYRMGARSGNVVKDEIGGAELVLAGGYTLAVPGAIAGDGDTAIAFDGTTAYAVANGGDGRFSFTGTAQYTVECWASWTPLASGVQYQHLIASSHGGGSTRVGTLLYVEPTDVNAAFEWDPGAQHVTNASLPAPGAFHHYAGVFDGSAAIVYVDGVAGDPNLRGTDSMPAHADDLTVGSDGPPGFYNHFSGAIDEVAIYGKALTAADLQRHIAAAAGK
jgi:hypothetical protein